MFDTLYYKDPPALRCVQVTDGSAADPDGSAGAADTFNSAALIGGLAGGALLLLAVAGYCYRKRRKNYVIKLRKEEIYDEERKFVDDIPPEQRTPSKTAQVRRANSIFLHSGSET